MVEIDGNWIGFYRYGEAYTDADKELKVPFRVTITRGINEFVGTMWEEPEYGGIQDDIIIKGRQDGDEIEFVKYYALEHFTDEHNQLHSRESENPTTVYYHGKFHREEAKFKGQWELPALHEDEHGVLHEDSQTGFWELWREQ